MEKDGGIDADKIANGAINVDKLADDAVNTDKIADGAVTADKLDEAVQEEIASKANASDVYTKEEADDLLKDKANVGDAYTKAEADELLQAKANAADVYVKDDVYNKNEVNGLLGDKANSADVYTKNETNDLLDDKANAADVYTKIESDELLEAKANAADVHTKDEINGLLNAKANAADVYAKTDVYTKSETDTKIDEKIASVTGGESAADVKLALETYRNAINVEIWGPEAASWAGTGEDVKPTYNPQYGNDTRIDKLEAVGAQANVIESISTPDGALAISNKNVALPLATASKVGLVKGTVAENGVAVAADGTMSVNSINVNKLVQTEGEWLILNGGSASV